MMAPWRRGIIFCEKVKWFAMRQPTQVGRNFSFPVLLNFSPTLFSTELFPKLTHRIFMSPSEILIPFTHSPSLLPSYPYHPPILSLWSGLWKDLPIVGSLKVLYFQRRPWTPSSSFVKPLCRLSPRVCSHLAHRFFYPSSGYLQSTRPWLHSLFKKVFLLKDIHFLHRANVQQICLWWVS